MKIGYYILFWHNFCFYLHLHCRRIPSQHHVQSRLANPSLPATLSLCSRLVAAIRDFTDRRRPWSKHRLHRWKFLKCDAEISCLTHPLAKTTLHSLEQSNLIMFSVIRQAARARSITLRAARTSPSNIVRMPACRGIVSELNRSLSEHVSDNPN